MLCRLGKIVLIHCQHDFSAAIKVLSKEFAPYQTRVASRNGSIPIWLPPPTNAHAFRRFDPKIVAGFAVNNPLVKVGKPSESFLSHVPRNAAIVEKEEEGIPRVSQHSYQRQRRPGRNTAGAPQRDWRARL